MQKDSLRILLTLTTITAIALLACAVPYTTAFRNARYARLSLDEQIRSYQDHVDDPLFLYYLGRKLNDNQRFQEALPITERAVGLEPESVRSRDEWARSQMGTGHISEAFGQIKQYLGTHPNSAEAHFLIAKIYLTQQNLTPARHALEETVRLDPNHAEAWSMLGPLHIKVGEYAKAKEALETAIRLRPNSARDHMQLAVLLTPTDSPLARVEFSRGVELAPTDPLCHRQYSLFLLDTNDPVGAEKESRRAYELDNKDMFTDVLVGRSLLAQSKVQEAIPFLEEAARLSPLEPVPVEALCRAYRRIGDTTKAAESNAKYLTLLHNSEERRHLEDITLNAPQDRDAHARYALALAKVGDVYGVLRQHAIANKSVSDSTRVLVASARDLNQAGRAREALPLIRKAMLQAQSSPEAIETLGDVLANLGRTHEAAIHYESIRDWKTENRAVYKKRLETAVLRIAASNAPAEKLLRKAQQSTTPSEIFALLTKALESDPDNTRCLRTLLRFQFRRGQTEEAMKSAERLAFISPEDGIAHSLMALLLLKKYEERPLPAEVEKEVEFHIQAGTPDLSVTPTLLYANGQLAMKRGNMKLAIQSFELAAKRDPSGVAVYRKLSEAQAASGDNLGAKRSLQEFDKRSQTP